jgi:DNA invertase Pin-like site-specific DNA recombinase
MDETGLFPPKNVAAVRAGGAGGWPPKEPIIHALTLQETMVEHGVSDSVPVERRPVGGALFKRLQSGDTLIAAKLDRLFRSALDALQTVANLKQRGIKLHLLDLGGDIAGNGLSKLFLTIAAAFAEAERDRIRERISQVKADQKSRGRYPGLSRTLHWVDANRDRAGATGERLILLQPAGVTKNPL